MDPYVHTCMFSLRFSTPTSYPVCPEVWEREGFLHLSLSLSLSLFLTLTRFLYDDVGAPGWYIAYKVVGGLHCLGPFRRA